MSQARYWVGQIGASYTVHAPDGQIVAFRPDQQAAESLRDALNIVLAGEPA